MTRGNLQLLAPYDAWHGAAHRGRWTDGEGALREVIVLLGPETIAAEAVDRARKSAAVALRLRHPGVLALLAVEPFGERIAWIYEDALALGLGHTLGHGEEALLPTRAAAEVVARVAEIMLEIGPDALQHPGPEAGDLLVDHTGQVRVAGFAGPFPRSPAMRAPQGDGGEVALVYRFGVLLAELVSGSAPTAASEKGGHTAVIRRALIRAMSRPGPVLSERYGDWLRGLLSFEPGERPPWSTIPSGLRTVAEGTAGPDLASWATTRFEDLRTRVESTVERHRGRDGTVLGRVTLDEGQPGEEADAAILSRRVAVPPSPVPAEQRVATQEADATAELVEEPTQEAPRRPDEPEVADSKPPIRVTSLLPIPVQVGPPPEAVRNRPSLPPGFFDDEEHTDPNEPVSGLGSVWFDSRTLWTAGMVLGLIAVALLAVNLVLWTRYRKPPAEVEEPQRSIADILTDGAQASTPAGGRGFVVTFAGPEGLTLDVDCQGRRGSGTGRVRVDQVSAGACDVSADVDGVRVTDHVEVVGPATLVCFQNGQRRCR